MSFVLFSQLEPLAVRAASVR